MTEHDERTGPAEIYPVSVTVPAATEDRNRLTTAFRFFLAIPHMILVGGPLFALGASWGTDNGWSWDWGWGSGSGLLGAVAFFGAVITWFAILFTGHYPDGLWRLATFYLRWRVRAVTYMTLLRDEYPPFGDGAYPAGVDVPRPGEPRDRVTIALRLILVLPHLFILALLGCVWAFVTAVAWVVILFTGRYPESLYGFSLGVLAWDMRVESYMLLLRDEYPPFTLRA